jgi:hypothetical protein
MLSRRECMTKVGERIDDQKDWRGKIDHKKE